MPIFLTLPVIFTYVKKFNFFFFVGVKKFKIVTSY